MSYPSLCLKMYPITNHCVLSFLTTILVLLIIPGSYCRQHADCSQPFHCGGIKNISYPFWEANRSVNCGYPGIYKLFNCQGDIPLIRIGSRTYGVLEINYPTQTFRVARQVLRDKILHKATLNNTKIFRFSSSYSDNGTETRNLDMTGVLISGQGINITCNSSFPVPMDRNMTSALASTTSSMKNVSLDALTKQWLARITSCKKCALSDWKCGYDAYVASVKCYIKKRRRLVKRGDAPFPGPSSTQGQRWIMERSGLPFPSLGNKLGQSRLVDRGSTGASFPSSRCTQGQRWSVESVVPSTSPLLQLEFRDDETLPSPSYPLLGIRDGLPLLSPLYTQSRRLLAESGMVPSPGPSSQPGRPYLFPRRLESSADLLLPRGISSVLGFVAITIASVIMIRKNGCSLNGAAVNMRSHITILLQKLPWKTVLEKTNPKVENFLAKNESLDPKRYKYHEIEKITNSFSEKLGTGGYGKVYKGTLPSGDLVAVKILRETGSTGEDFMNEVASISKTSHVNVVKLLGFCYERNKRALVYEFMPNKSLDNFICNTGSSTTDDQLGWEIMYNIAVGVAQGLDYLHSGCNTRIIHFDIKPKNILLDENFWPKIADFGLAHLCKMQQNTISMAGMRGTFGYMAPEVFSRNYGGVSHKSDVYSYGMMVLEMVRARNIVSIGPIQSSDSYFPDQIYEREIIGPSRNLDAIVRDEKEKTKRKMLLVGFWCIQTTPSARPSMSKVVDMLKGSLQSIQIPPKPILFSPVESTTNTSEQEFVTLN